MSRYDRDAEDARALEALRVRHEAGDPTAVVEALLYVCGPVMRQDPIPGAAVQTIPPSDRWGPKPELPGMLGKVQYPPLPDWLEIAVREGMTQAFRSGEDSARKAFGIPVASGTKTTNERNRGTAREGRALAAVLGIQAARRDTRRPYPPGEDAYTLAGCLFRPGEPLSGETVKRWAKAARARNACATHRAEIERRARSGYLRALVTGRYPPFPPMGDGEAWDRALHTGQIDRVNKRRFC